MTASSPRPRAAQRRAAVLVAPLVTLVALLLVGACGNPQADSSAGPASSRSPQPTAERAPGATSANSTGGSAQAGGSAGVPGVSTVARAAPRALRPVRIRIPAIGVDATMTDLGIDNGGAIEVPSDPAQAGWLDTTPAPGQRGPTVVAGHVDSTRGPAVFYRLRELSVGDRIIVTRRNGSEVTFTVDGVRTYPKSRFPTREVYGPAPGPVLRLVTCGGDYVKSGGGYLDNVVVYSS